jgi:hypothetical protein
MYGQLKAVARNDVELERYFSILSVSFMLLLWC